MTEDPKLIKPTFEAHAVKSPLSPWVERAVREELGVPEPAPTLDFPAHREWERRYPWLARPLFRGGPPGEPATLEAALEVVADLRRRLDDSVSREAYERHRADEATAAYARAAGELHALENDLEWPPIDRAAQAGHEHGRFMDIKVYEDPAVPPWQLELRREIDRSVLDQLLHGGPADSPELRPEDVDQ